MSCCCFDRHGHPSSTACLFSYRSGSGRNVFIVGLDASLCLWYVQAAQLRGTCVQCSTVAPVCLCVFLVRFNFVCPLKHSKSTQAQAFCCLTRAQRGGKCKCMCTHLVLISSPPFCWKHWEGFIISVMVCQLVSHSKAISLSQQNNSVAPCECTLTHQ